MFTQTQKLFVGVNQNCTAIGCNNYQYMGPTLVTYIK